MGKKRNVFNIVLLFLFPLFLTQAQPLAVQAAAEYQFTLADGQSEAQKEVTLTIHKPRDEQLFLSYVNLVQLEASQLNEQNEHLVSEQSQASAFSQTPDGYQIILSTVSGVPELTLSIPVTIEQLDQPAAIQLYSADRVLLAEQRIEGKALQAQTQPQSQIETPAQAPQGQFEPLLPLVPPLEETPAEKNIAAQEQAIAAQAQTTASTGSLLTPEQEAANELANQRSNFDPLVKVAEVTTWQEFSAAYNDNSVTKIVMKANLSNQGAPASQNLTGRRAAIEIDGQGHQLFLRVSTSLELYSGTTQQEGLLFHMHDMIIDQGAETRLSWSFINGTDGVVNDTRARFWRFRLGNIRTPEGKRPVGGGSGVGRVGRFNNAEVTVYGQWNIKTSAENFYVGSMIYEDNTQYVGETTSYNYSVIWHVLNTETGKGYTGETMEHTIGKNASVYLKNSYTLASNYPAVYSNFQALTVGEGATFSANMIGNAVSLYASGSSFVLKSGATANLLTRGTGAVISFCNNYTSVVVNPGASLFVSGTTDNGTSAAAGDDAAITRYGLIDFRGRDYSGDGFNPYSDLPATGSAQRIFLMDAPKAYDFNNKLSYTTGYRARVMEIPNNRGCLFQLRNSDVDLWQNANYSDNPASSSFTKVANLQLFGRDAALVSSDNTELATLFLPNEYRRMSGMNEPPQLEWTPITDADTYYEARIKIGDFPDRFDEETGEVIRKPVYAAAGQVSVVFEKSLEGNISETVGPVVTDAEGKIKVVNTDNRFNRANETITAKADRGGWESESSIIVLDVTPPELAKLKGEGDNEGVVTNAMKQLIAEGCEPKAKFLIKLQDGSDDIRSFNGVVNDQGQLIFDLPYYLNAGEKITIYLQDNAPAVELPDRPTTNTDNGNVNPDEELVYREAIFKAPQPYIVQDVLPDEPGIEKRVTNPSDPFPTETSVSDVRVGDLLTYTITVLNNKSNGVETIWKNVKVSDTLIDFVDFDEAFADIKIAKGAEPSQPIGGAYAYQFDSATRELSFELGDLKTQESVTITFSVKINEGAVGSLITNEALAVGDSPREAAFVPGPETPDAARATYSVTSSIASYPKEAEGTLMVTSYPETIDFYSHVVSTNSTQVKSPAYSNDLKVRDQRNERRPWSITIELTKELTLVGDATITLPGTLFFNKGGQQNSLFVGSGPLMVAEHTNSNSFDYNVSANWTEDGDGLKLIVRPGQVKALGDYSGQLEWHLINAYQGEEE